MFKTACLLGLAGLTFGVRLNIENAAGFNEHEIAEHKMTFD